MDPWYPAKLATVSCYSNSCNKITFESTCLEKIVRFATVLVSMCICVCVCVWGEHMVWWRALSSFTQSQSRSYQLQGQANKSYPASQGTFYQALLLSIWSQTNQEPTLLQIHLLKHFTGSKRNVTKCKWEQIFTLKKAIISKHRYIYMGLC